MTTTILAATQARWERTLAEADEPGARSGPAVQLTGDLKPSADLGSDRSARRARLR